MVLSGYDLHFHFRDMSSVPGCGTMIMYVVWHGKKNNNPKTWVLGFASITQGSNPSLPRCRQVLYLLSHKGSPKYSADSNWSLFFFCFQNVTCSFIPHQVGVFKVKQFIEIIGSVADENLQPHHWSLSIIYIYILIVSASLLPRKLWWKLILVCYQGYLSIISLFLVTLGLS